MLPRFAGIVRGGFALPSYIIFAAAGQRTSCTPGHYPRGVSKTTLKKDPQDEKDHAKEEPQHHQNKLPPVPFKDAG